MIEFPPEASLYSPQTLQMITEVHGIMQKQPGIGNVWSLETLRRWLAEKAGRPDVATLKEYVDILPQYLVRRFISADQHAVVIAGRVPDVDASRIRPIVAALDRALDMDQDAPHPSSREGHPSTAGWNSGFLLLSGLILNGFHAAAAACSRVHRNSVPSTQMRCMITASRRARATIAFFIPRRLAICMAHALSQDHFFERSML